MPTRVKSLLVALALGLVAIPSASAETTNGRIETAEPVEHCYAQSTGSCTAETTVTDTGTFSTSVELTTPAPLPLFSSTYGSGMALAYHELGFELSAPTEAARITVDLSLSDASASWIQEGPSLTSGEPAGRATVLAQLFGADAASGCLCGWSQQGAPDVKLAEVTSPGTTDGAPAQDLTLSFVAAHPDAGRLLPAGHYTVRLRIYSLADTRSAGDWGTLTASLSGQIQNISVETLDSMPLPSSLTLSVAGVGSNRVLTAVLSDPASGAGIADRTITFSADGTTLGTAVTDAAGNATFPVSGRYRGGSHEFTATFAGDDEYQGASTAS